MKAHEDQIKEILHRALEALDEDMAVKLKENYTQLIETFNENLHDILKSGFGMGRIEVFDFLGKSEKSAYEFCIKELKNVFAQNAPGNMLRKFNAKFKKDEGGKLREWRDIEETKIKEIFEESKLASEAVFEQFKRVFFPTGITKMEETPRPQEDFDNSRATVTMEDLLNDEGNLGTGGGFRRSRTSISISSIRILTEDEIARVKTRFYEEIETAYAEAIRAHVSP